jgi:hypothetical protein
VIGSLNRHSYSKVARLLPAAAAAAAAVVVVVMVVVTMTAISEQKRK